MSDDTNSPVALTSASTVIPRVASSVADQADSEEFLDGFLRVEAEVHAVPKDARIGVNLDVVGAVATALGALRKINQLARRHEQPQGHGHHSARQAA